LVWMWVGDISKFDGFVDRCGQSTRRFASIRTVHWGKQFLNATIVDVVMCFC
jgi:hypothetical protein